MAVKTDFSENDFVGILSKYHLGEYLTASPITQGSVQTNFMVQTTKGKFVFRYYENRSEPSVLFEAHLIRYLKKKQYLCPAIYKDKQGKYVGLYKKKPYALFEFVEGEHIEQPDAEQRRIFIQKVAELHILTRNYRPAYKAARGNYNAEFCERLAFQKAEEINTKNAHDKLTWFISTLQQLHLPQSLPRGICHGDFHFSNVLYTDHTFAALLDFDDANYTYLLFDLVGLIEAFAWPHNGALDFEQARMVVAEYTGIRPLNANEKRHLFDVYQLSILIDGIWYFERGDAVDFYEKRKMDDLNRIGREPFYKHLFA